MTSPIFLVSQNALYSSINLSSLLLADSWTMSVVKSVSPKSVTSAFSGERINAGNPTPFHPSLRAGFKRERPCRSSRGLHKSKQKSTGFIETPADLNSRKIILSSSAYMD
jgi:hypothetical protein